MNLFWNSGQVQAQKPPGLSRKTPYLSLNSTDSAGKRPNISFKESSGFTLTDVLKHSPEPLFSLWLGSSSVLYQHSMAIFYCGDSAGCLYLLLFVVWFHNQNPTQKELFTMWIKEERDRSLLSQSSWWRHTWTWGGGRATAVEGGGLPHFKVIKQLARNHFTAAFLLADSWWTCGWLTIHLHYIWPKVRQTVWLRSTDERLVIFAWFKLELSIKTHPSIINNHVM